MAPFFPSSFSCRRRRESHCRASPAPQNLCAASSSNIFTTLLPSIPPLAVLILATLHYRHLSGSWVLVSNSKQCPALSTPCSVLSCPVLSCPALPCPARPAWPACCPANAIMFILFPGSKCFFLLVLPERPQFTSPQAHTMGLGCHRSGFPLVPGPCTSLDFRSWDFRHYEWSKLVLPWPPALASVPPPWHGLRVSKGKVKGGCCLSEARPQRRQSSIPVNISSRPNQ